jgi:hypothetical protein
MACAPMDTPHGRSVVHGVACFIGLGLGVGVGVGVGLGFGFGFG